MTIHNFKQQLKYSENASHEAFWEAIYRRAFPGMVSHMPCPGDFQSQRMGIDRVILLSNGRVLRIDEKKRDRVYNDVLLEVVSNDRTGAPGWIEKDLVIDYLSYAFMPTRKVYLFDWLMLRRAWMHFGQKWQKDYRPVTAFNEGYKTISVPVPLRVLQDAVSLATTIQVTEFEVEKVSVERKAAA